MRNGNEDNVSVRVESKLFAVERSERQKVELQGVAAATKRSTKDFDVPFQRECYFHLASDSASYCRSHCASLSGFAPFHAYRVLLRKTSTGGNGLPL